MGQYGVFLHDAAGRGIPTQRIFHTKNICIEINGSCADPQVQESTLTSRDGIGAYDIRDMRENHWFYWNPANPNGSGANSAHRYGDPVNYFWADIEM